MNPRECFWFGTVEKSSFIATPLRGADSTPAAWGVSGTLLNGGGYALNSWGSHKQYTYEWPSTSSPQMAQLMKSYRDGTYGRGLLYFLDPQIYTTNILPARWADPSMALDYDGPPLVPGVIPTPTPTANAAVNNLPVTSATYSLNSVSAVTSGRGPGSVFVPIPDGHTLFMSAFYSFTGSGGIFVTPVNPDGSFGAPVKLTALANNSTNLAVDRFSGYKGVCLWGGRTTGAASALTVAALSARLLKTSDVPVYTPWVTQAENLFTNPGFRNTSGPVEVRRNLVTNPSFETNTTGWAAASNCTLTRTTGVSLFGGAAAQLQATTSANMAIDNGAYGHVNNVPVVAGRTYTMSAYFMAHSTSRFVRIDFGFVDASGNGMGYQFGPEVEDTSGAWVRAVSSATAPAGAVALRVVAYVRSPAASEIHYLDGLMVEEAATANPYFDGSQQPKVRRNLCAHPIAAGVGSIAGYERRAGSSSDLPVVDGDYLSVHNVINTGGIYYSTGVKAPSSDPVAFSVTVRATSGLPIRLGVYNLNTASWIRSIDSQPLDFVSDGSPRRESVIVSSGYSPGDTLRLYACKAATGGSVSTGTVSIRHVLAEASAVVGDYFDGSTGAPQGYASAWEGAVNESASYLYDADFEVSWTGAENASASILTGKAVAGLIPARCHAIQSRRYAGSSSEYSVRLIASHPTNGDSYVQTGVPVDARTSGTLTGVSIAEAPIPPGQGSLMSALPDTRTHRPVAVAGAFPLRHFFTSLTSLYVARLYHNSTLGSPDVWFSDVGLFAGDYDGPYFDGSTPSPSDTEQYLWSGAPGNSTSLYQTRTRLSGNVGKMNAIESGPWIGGQGHSGARFSGMPSYVNNGPINGGQVGFAATFIETGDSEAY